MKLVPSLVSLLGGHSGRVFVIGLAAAGMLVVPKAFALSGSLSSLPADGQAHSDGSVSSTSATFGRIGAGTGIRHSVVHVFEIPPAVLQDPTQRFATATYTVKLGSGPVMTHNCDLYGLPFRTTAAVLAADFYEGVLDPNAALVKDNFLTPSVASYSVHSVSDGALVDYLNSALTAARNNGATTAYVKLRLNLDSYQWSNSYLVGMNEAQSGYPPKLDYTTETVEAWREVPLGGGGRVTGLVSDPAGSVIYCRTDVGGIFRWIPAQDGTNGRWKSVSDTMVPYLDTDSSTVMATEGVIVDPTNANRVYVGTGTGQSKGIYVSENRGETWTRINSTISTKGNDGYKMAGNRLAVDPNTPSIVWYGSGAQGLNKLVKSGTAWSTTQISATAVPFGADPAGVTFVICDRNNGGPTIVYAGVKHDTDGGVYRSADAGTSWSKVAGAAFPTPISAQLAPNGTLYVVGGSVSGVAKILQGGTLSVLSTLPARDYQCLAIDPNDASGNTVYVAEKIPKHCAILRSTDGGATWKTQTTVFNGPANGDDARTEPDGTPSLTGDWFGAVTALMVNPANSNELWAGDFYGVYRTRNAQDLGTTPGAFWYLLQKGQEETVGLDLLNAPTGAALLTGVGDVGGGRYLTTTERPSGTHGNLLAPPKGGNTTSLDFSEGSPQRWARAWISQDNAASAGGGAYSLDGGASWLTFGTIDFKQVANGPADGWETWDVSTYVAKAKAAGATSVTLVVSSGNTDPVLAQPLKFHSRNATNAALQPRLVVDGTPVYAEADTTVSGAQKTTNYGADAFLEVRYAYTGSEGNKRFCYLRFNLSALPTVNSAQLELCRIAATNTIVFPVGVFGTTNPTWVEGNGGTDNSPVNEMTWNNKPRPLGTGNGDPQMPDYYAGSTKLAGGRIVVSATNADLVAWLPINAGLHYSVDRGVTWKPATGGPASEITRVYTTGDNANNSCQPLAADRGNGYLYAANFGGAAHLIYRSADGGKTWQQISSINNGGSYNMRSPQMVAAPVSAACPNGGDVWVCDNGIWNKQGGGLWRSIDSAATWTKVSGVGKVTQVAFGKGVAGTGYSVFVHGVVNGVKGMYRSDDYATTWIRLPDPTLAEISVLAGDRQNHGKVFIGTGGRGTFQFP